MLAGTSAVSPLRAQQPAASTGTEAPAAQQAAPVNGPHPPQYYVWKKAHDAQLLVDFGGLERFRKANAMLAAPKPGEDRVVFMGDSITEAWKLENSFPGKPYINRGISGQTSPQMLVRFRQDVIDLKPKVVIIMTGTNDSMENTGPMTVEQSVDWLHCRPCHGKQHSSRAVLGAAFVRIRLVAGTGARTQDRGIERMDQAICG
jgi:hypothetical protein